MIKARILFLVGLFITSVAFGQVGISSDNNLPHPSAGLDVNFSDKGFLPPRLTFEQRNAIVDPAEGLMVFCTNCNTDGSGIISTFQGGKWRNLTWNCPGPVEPATGVNISGGQEVSWTWNPVPIALGYKWNTSDDYNTAIDLGNATLKVETGLACATSYTRFVWAYNDCGHSAAVALNAATLQVPFSGIVKEETHIAKSSEITWNWSPADGASGYKWSTTDDFNTAIDLETATSYLESGLDCNTLYRRFIWAYDPCGHGTPLMLTQSTVAQTTSPVPGAHIAAPSQVTWQWSAVDGATGYKWSTDNDFALATDLGQSTSYTETLLACNTSYTRYLWAYNACGYSQVTVLAQSTSVNPANPQEGMHTAASTQITWNWDPAVSATGYKWSTINDYATATDLGSLTTYTESGLTTGIHYTRYVWAYGTCGVSASTVMSALAWSCGDPFLVNHVAGVVAPVDKTVSYGTVANLPGVPSKCWITSNLGASQQAVGVNDASEPSAGWYWQFNRKQGYLCNGASLTPTWGGASINEYFDWAAENDPCTLELGSAWRIPTRSEWNSLDAAGGWTNWSGPWNSLLKLHAAGYLNGNSGLLSDRGTAGYYWGSTQEDQVVGWLLYFNNGNSVMGNGGKSDGIPLRCLSE